MAAIKHFLDLSDHDAATLRAILDLGVEYKKALDKKTPATAGGHAPLAGKTLAMVFEKPSTRTRVSFEVGMRQLGGDVVTLGHSETQLGRGESIADTARVLSRYVDAIMLRATSVQHMREMAENASVPVINGLTDRSHPCQLMADIMTFEEHRGPIKGRVVVWSGDGNNVAASWIEAAARFDFSLRLACPAQFSPAQDIVDWARAEGGDITVTEDPAMAAASADCIVTDTWLSMGVDGDKEQRLSMLAPYRIDDKLMALAKPDAIFLHCLPVNREREVSASVIDGPNSVVWDEAENRLHSQKGILHWCLT